MNDTYLPDATYDALLTALENAKPSWSQPDFRSRIVEILGEAGVWPAACLPAKPETGYRSGEG